MSQNVTQPSILSTSNGVHHFSFCLNNLQYLFICFMLSPPYFYHLPRYSYFKWLKQSSVLFFVGSTLQRNSPNKCFHLTFLQVKAEGSSHEISFLVESFFSQSNRRQLLLLHQTSRVTKLFHSFQILSINCTIHSSSFYCRHSHDFSSYFSLCQFSCCTQRMYSAVHSASVITQ